MNRDEGAGTVLAAAVVAAQLLPATGAFVLDGHRRVVTAALAGADVALGNATGVPCDRAAAIAVSAGVRLDRCAQRATPDPVHAATSVLGVDAGTDAIAGPPPPR